VYRELPRGVNKFSGAESGFFGIEMISKRTVTSSTTTNFTDHQVCPSITNNHFNVKTSVKHSSLGPHGGGGGKVY